jgi:hypothetical protein
VAEISLTGFLQRSLGRPWAWGTDDCVMWAMSWVHEKTGVDPVARLRGSYASADECRDVIAREGGFMPALGYLMDTAGFERTQAPRDGDVGIVSAPVDMGNRLPVCGAIMAIRCGEMWAARGRHELVWHRLPTITAWRL